MFEIPEGNILSMSEPELIKLKDSKMDLTHVNYSLECKLSSEKKNVDAHQNFFFESDSEKVFALRNFCSNIMISMKRNTRLKSLSCLWSLNRYL